MNLQRLGVATLALLLAGASAEAEVRLVIRSSGRKAIYNLPGHGGGENLAWFARQRNRPSKYDPIINKYCDRWDVDPVLVKAVITVESNFDPSRVSRKGARGLMQLMPGTARRFSVSNLHDPEQNIRGGVQYLSVLFGMFGNDLSRVLAAYNAGENAVVRYDGIPPYGETQSYVRKALSAFHGRPWGGGVVARGLEGRTLAGGFKSSSEPALVRTGTGAADWPKPLIVNLR